MRPAYLTPKLTTANRLAIRRLRAENPREWTLGKLAQRFGVHRSTISHVLRRRIRASVEDELASLRAAVEDTGPIRTEELLSLKKQEWSRQLLAERDLGRQQQLVNLLKSIEPMLDPEKLREREWQARGPSNFADDERRGIEALRGLDDEARGLALLRGEVGSTPA